MATPNLTTSLQSNGILCRDQTPTSAQKLQSQGQLNAKDFLEISPDIEHALMEAFIEDDYDGKLHLTTLSMNKSHTDRTTEDEIVGIAFWREVPSGEMNEWLDLQRISRAITDRKLSSSPSFTTYEEHDSSQNAMELVLGVHIDWIQNALQCCHADDTTSTIDDDLPPTSTIISMLRHEWIKIELIAVKSTHRAQHLGRILMGCTLAKAHALHDNEHVIPHIAGGGASKNIPAARLYKSYGFVPVPRHDEGGPFAKPDKDLCVLENIGVVLNSLPWDEMMAVNKHANYEKHGCCNNEEVEEKNVGESCNWMLICCNNQ